MHELSIAMCHVESAVEAASQHEGRVVAVHVRLGRLSGVVHESLESAWALARCGTALADAELEIEDVPVAANCPTCMAEREIASIQWFYCPECGGPVTEIVRGKELELVALEMGE